MYRRILVGFFFIAFSSFVITMPAEQFVPKVHYDKQKLKKQMDFWPWYITQEGKDEEPYVGKLLYHFEDGVYNCVICEKSLFSSEHKIGDHGWPTFTEVIGQIAQIDDNNQDFTLQRDCCKCENCGAHLGYVYHSPGSIPKRYMINSNSLKFQPDYPA